ncbi:MAG: hypothetical protein QOF89_4372 [Acidobacteriota bacterium]|jgi:hypothetical protein|nr:hypothetical protein [Acidobacteriota bacterium]
MRVEVDIFSGRPSPFWTASPQEAEALTDRLRLLTGISSRLEEDGGLGYRGLVVTGLPGYGDIRIWNSRVTVGSGEEAKLFADRRISRPAVRSRRSARQPE